MDIITPTITVVDPLTTIATDYITTTSSCVVTQLTQQPIVALRGDSDVDVPHDWTYIRNDPVPLVPMPVVATWATRADDMHHNSLKANLATYSI